MKRLMIRLAVGALALWLALAGGAVYAVLLAVLLLLEY